MLVLSVIQGPEKGRTFQLPDHEPQLLGRSSEALPISDSTVSRRHAELTPDDGAWYIRDLQSQNGTYVNGVRIRERIRLRPGDQVRVGSTLMVFGATESRDPDVVRVLRPSEIAASLERTLPASVRGASMEDSIIMAEPEPRAAAVNHLRVLYQLTQLLTGKVLDKYSTLRAVMELVFEEFRPERGFITLVAADGEIAPRPAVVKYRTPPMSQDDATIHVPRTILQHVLRKHEGVLASNAMTDPRFASGDSVQRMHVRSAICAPIKYRERVMGAIYIDSSVANYTFTAEQLALLNAVGAHTALALANHELVTQQLQTERLAAIGETVATLSHSIKNILQGLKGGADVVELGLKKDDLKIARNGWDILRRNLDRILSLTMNMLAFSRQRRVETELTKVGPLVQDCLQLLEPQAKVKNVAVITDVDAEIPPVMLDGALIHQAVLNLLTNALEAVAPDKGVVTVRVAYVPAGGAGSTPEEQVPPALRGKPRLEIGVFDNGPGIPRDKLAWIFEPFNTTKGIRGTGLGLSVVRRVVEEHRGAILVESEEGKGATFRMFLPADATNAQDPSATAASRTAAGQSPESTPRVFH
jgi:signal transduction histidine kinase